MRKSILLMTVASLAITPLVAQESEPAQSETMEESDLTMQGNRQRLELGPPDAEVVQAEDGERVTVKGRVQDVYGDSFILDYGGGDITVEMEDAYSDEFPLEVGQNVSVSGRIDDVFFDRRTINAESVYSNELGTRYMAEEMSDEDEWFFSFDQPESRLAMDDEWLTVTGTIVSVDGDELTLDVGSQNISVDLDRLDEEISAGAGDRVSVFGEMDSADFWEGREIIARSVTPLT